MKSQDPEIEGIKHDIDLVRLVQDSGIKLQKVGSELKGRCPFHEDTAPSLSVSSTKRVFRCFGCGAGGSCFDWVMKRDGVSFAHAKAILRATLPSGPSPLSRKPEQVPELLKPRTESASGG